MAITRAVLWLTCFKKGNEEKEEAGSDRERDRVIAVRFTSTPQLGSFMSPSYRHD